MAESQFSGRTWQVLGAVQDRFKSAADVADDLLLLPDRAKGALRTLERNGYVVVEYHLVRGRFVRHFAASALGSERFDAWLDEHGEATDAK